MRVVPVAKNLTSKRGDCHVTSLLHPITIETTVIPVVDESGRKVAEFGARARPPSPLAVLTMQRSAYETVDQTP